MQGDGCRRQSQVMESARMKYRVAPLTRRADAFPVQNAKFRFGSVGLRTAGAGLLLANNDGSGYAGHDGGGDADDGWPSDGFAGAGGPALRRSRGRPCRIITGVA